MDFIGVGIPRVPSAYRRWRLNLVAKRLNLVATCNNFGELQLDENGGGQCTGDMAGIEHLEIFPAHQL